MISINKMMVRRKHGHMKQCWCNSYEVGRIFVSWVVGMVTFALLDHIAGWHIFCCFLQFLLMCYWIFTPLHDLILKATLGKLPDSLNITSSESKFNIKTPQTHRLIQIFNPSIQFILKCQYRQCIHLKKYKTFSFYELCQIYLFSRFITRITCVTWSIG